MSTASATHKDKSAESRVEVNRILGKQERDGNGRGTESGNGNNLREIPDDFTGCLLCHNAL